MTNTLISETENDIEEFQIAHEYITERILFRNKLRNFKGFYQEKNRAVWTVERREKQKERTREIWRERKKQGSS